MEVRERGKDAMCDVDFVSVWLFFSDHFDHDTTPFAT